MGIVVWFWILMFCWVAFGVYRRYIKDWIWGGGVLLVFLLFLILGWAQFGGPIQGR